MNKSLHNAVLLASLAVAGTQASNNWRPHGNKVRSSDLTAKAQRARKKRNKQARRSRRRNRR